ncbi:MAG: kinase [Hyphomonadaceae bacterium]
MSAVAALVYEIIQSTRARAPDRPALIGVAGAQGSGKSYACRLLALAHQPRFAHFSLDDVYLTKAQRQQMAREVHPLFITRGPPGTHDLDVAIATIIALKMADAAQETRFQRFDKASDDRAPRETWPAFRGPPEAILVDGWCLGALAPPPGPPLNAIEHIDSDGVWRAAQARYLEESYADFFARFDAIVYLQAPSWEIVRTWRGEQEAQTLGRALTAQENAALDRFVMHYERLTRSMLAGHHMAKWIVHLDEARNVLRVEER